MCMHLYIMYSTVLKKNVLSFESLWLCFMCRVKHAQKASSVYSPGEKQWGGVNIVHIPQRQKSNTPLETPPLLTNGILGRMLNTAEPVSSSVKRE